MQIISNNRGVKRFFVFHGGLDNMVVRDFVW